LKGKHVISSIRARERACRQPQRARERQAEYHGSSASVDIHIGDMFSRCPLPQPVDDTTAERFNELNARLSGIVTREDDIEFRYTLKAAAVLPVQTIRCDMSRPT